MTAKVSVVIPTYNGTRFIREALESVFAQTLPPQEIIVVDDASTDGTPDLIEEIAKDSPAPLKLIRLTKNSGGPAHPMNVGIKAAETEFIALLDHDDWMAPNKLSDSVRLLERFRNAAMVFGQYEAVDAAGSRIDRPEEWYTPFPTVESLISGGEIMRVCVQHGYRLGGAGGATIRKITWDRIGCFDSSFKIAWDYDFVARLALDGQSFGYVPEIIYRHRVHTGNLENHDGRLLVRREVIHILRSVYRDSRIHKETKTAIALSLSKRLRNLAKREFKRRSLSTALFSQLSSTWYRLRAGGISSGVARKCGRLFSRVSFTGCGKVREDMD